MADNLDQLFREKLRDRQFSPEAGDWMAMEKKLNSSPISGSGSNSGLWLFFSFLTSLVIIGMVAATNYYPFTESKNEIKTEGALKTKNENNISLEDRTKTAKTNQSKSTSTLLKSASISNNTEENTAPFKKESLRENASYSIAGKENVKAENFNEADLKIENISAPLEDTRNYETQGQKASKSPLALEDVPSEKHTEQSEVRNLAASSISSSTEAMNSKTGAFENNDQLQMTSSLSNQNPLSSFNYSGLRNVDTKKKPTLLQLNSISINTFEDNTTKQNIIDLSDDYSSAQRIKSLMPKRKLPIQLSLAAFGEVAYIMKKITGESEFASLIRTRNEEEKNIMSAGGGIEVQAKYKQWSISTGFSSTMQGENIQYEEKYNSEWEVTSTIDSDTSWTEEIVFTYDTVYNPVDSTIYIYVDSSFITVIDSIYFTTVYDSSEVLSNLGLSAHNGRSSISYWEIPLYFSYQFELGDFYLTPGLGITIGFLKITRGHYLAKDQQSLIEINSDYAVLRKTLLNGQVNMGVGYRLGDRFSIEATPVFRFNLSNIFEDNGINQRYKSINLQFKLRYYF